MALKKSLQYTAVLLAGLAAQVATERSNVGEALGDARIDLKKARDAQSSKIAEIERLIKQAEGAANDKSRAYFEQKKAEVEAALQKTLPTVVRLTATVQSLTKRADALEDRWNRLDMDSEGMARHADEVSDDAVAEVVA